LFHGQADPAERQIVAETTTLPLTPQQINALNNLQEEYTTCGYYYQLQIARAT
jgi:hypothetical protein